MANKKISLRPVGPIGSPALTGTISCVVTFNATPVTFTFDLSTMRGTDAAVAMQAYIDSMITPGSCVVRGGWADTPGAESRFDIDFVGTYQNFAGTISDAASVSMTAQDVWTDDPDFNTVGNVTTYEMSNFVGGEITIDDQDFPYNVTDDLTALQAYLDAEYTGLVATGSDHGNDLILTGSVPLPEIHSNGLLVSWTTITAVTLRQNSVLQPTTINQSPGLTMANFSWEPL